MQWDYLSIRFNYKGRGITKEFGFLDVNGERVSSDGEAPSNLPELLEQVGQDEWELVTHTVNQMETHWMHFKRPAGTKRDSLL